MGKQFTAKYTKHEDALQFVDFYVEKKYQDEIQALLTSLPDYAFPGTRIVGEKEVDFSIEENYVEICTVLQIDENEWCPSGYQPLFEINFGSEASTSENIAFTEAGQRVFKALINTFEQLLVASGFVKVELKGANANA